MRLEHRRRGRLLAALLSMPAAAWLMLGGCDLSSQPGAGTEPAVPVSMAGEPAVTLPLDNYVVTDAQRSTLDRAQRVLTERCLARLGLPADADAVRDGSGRSSAAGQPRNVVVAAPVGGCVGEAVTTLADGAPRPADPDVVSRLSAEAHRRAEHDSRVRAAVADFAACIRRPDAAQPDAAQPDTARPDAGQSDTGQPTLHNPTASPATGGRGRTAAIEDSCRAQTRVVAVLAAVESVYQARAIELNRGALATVKTNLEVRLRNAAAVAG